MIAPSTLFMSWAIPPARVPMASIFCAWRSCASSRSYSSIAACCSVTSRTAASTVGSSSSSKSCATISTGISRAPLVMRVVSKRTSPRWRTGSTAAASSRSAGAEARSCGRSASSSWRV